MLCLLLYVKSLGNGFIREGRIIWEQGFLK
jgi:hypothetical protein